MTQTSTLPALLDTDAPITRTQAAARGALALLAALVFGLIALLLMPNPGTASAVTPGAVDTAPAVQVSRIDAIPDLDLAEVRALAPSTELTDTQVLSMLEVADLICEGMTAGVPLMNMADSLVWNQGLTDEEAHDFVRTVAQTHCG